MKLFIDPVYTAIKQSRCSTYFALKQTALRFLNADKNNFVYCAVPDLDDERNEFENDDLVEHERWLNIPVFYGRDRYQNMFFPPDELRKFSTVGEYWDWDVLLTTRNNGFFWYNMCHKRVYGGVKKMLVLGEPFPILSFKKTVSQTDIQDFNIISSYLGFDRIYIQTKWERDNILKMAKKFLSPYWVSELDKRLVVTFPSPNVDFDFPFKKKVSNDNVLNLVYTQRLDNFERRVDKMLTVLRKIFILRKDVNINVFTNSEMSSIGNDTSFISWGKLPRNEFYEMLKTANAFISWSIDEGMPYSLFEAICFGVIPIVKREPWSEDFLGKDYWGLVDTIEEAVTKIFDIKNDKVSAHKRFLEWYDGFFRKVIVARGNQADVLLNDFNKHIKTCSYNVRERIKDDRKLCYIINNSKLKSVSFNDDSIFKLDGVRVKNRKIFYENIPLSRVRDYYRDRLALISGGGWRDTNKPGVLIR